MKVKIKVIGKPGSGRGVIQWIIRDALIERGLKPKLEGEYDLSVSVVKRRKKQL